LLVPRALGAMASGCCCCCCRLHSKPPLSTNEGGPLLVHKCTAAQHAQLPARRTSACKAYRSPAALLQGGLQLLVCLLAPAVTHWYEVD
jgi:hypothetical protein